MSGSAQRPQVQAKHRSPQANAQTLLLENWDTVTQFTYSVIGCYALLGERNAVCTVDATLDELSSSVIVGQCDVWAHIKALSIFLRVDSPSKWLP